MANSNKKVAIVTGANCGVGLEITRHLGYNGFTVILACRSIERAETAISQLNNESSNLTTDADFSAMRLDVSDYKSVRQFASEVQKHYTRLDVLVNNAGVSFTSDSERHLNADGHELTIATNHLGHFLLTQLLLPLLKQTATAAGTASILNISSDIHLQVGGAFGFRLLDFEDLMLEKPGAYKAMQAYKNSKTMNVLHARRLARDLEGSNIRVNSAHPGFLPSTQFFRDFNCCLRCFLVCCCHGLCRCCRITRSASEAGSHLASVAAGLQPQHAAATGLYFYDGSPKQPANEATIRENEDKLWDWSVNAVGLNA